MQSLQEGGEAQGEEILQLLSLRRAQLSWGDLTLTYGVEAGQTQL